MSEHAQVLIESLILNTQFNIDPNKSTGQNWNDFMTWAYDNKFTPGHDSMVEFVSDCTIAAGEHLPIKRFTAGTIASRQSIIDHILQFTQYAKILAGANLGNTVEN